MLNLCFSSQTKTSASQAGRSVGMAVVATSKEAIAATVSLASDVHRMERLA